MLISEIFYSLQGEGALTGVPSVFVRTSGCNLRCRWCDTKYASWNPTGTEMTIEKIIRAIEAHPAAQHVVITGGEPMIAKGMPELTKKLRSRGKHLTIETAATVPPDGIDCDLASLSPKLSNATPHGSEIEQAWIQRHESRRLQPKVIDAWMAAGDYQLKFVVATAPDIEEIGKLIGALAMPPQPHKVLLMPEGITPSALRERQDLLVQLCKEHGYRFCSRLHVDLFGNTPGT